jgi:predicted ATPase
MIERVTGGKTLPSTMVDQILLRTDGVPLFVEELTKAVLESGLLTDKGDYYSLSGPLTSLAVPSTLQDSLMARLDRLAPVKEVAQIGAVIGRRFSFELISAVAPLPDSVLREALNQLAEAELVFHRGVPPEATYTFKHALIQDAAYGTLLRGKRQQLHARVAEVLEDRFPETVQMEPELLAHHCTEAGFVDKAIDYWRKAALQATARSATSEAIAQLTKGFNLLESLPSTPDRHWQELGLQLTRGKAISAAKGFAAPEGGQAYTRARELCEQLGEVSQLAPILYGLILYHLYRDELASASALARELLRLAEQDGTTSALFYAHRAMGVSSLPSGDFVSARMHLERALSLYNPVEHRNQAIHYAFDPQVVCLDYLSRTLLPLGYPEQALARHNAALSAARQLSHLTTLAFTLFYGCILHQLLDDRAGVQDLVTCLTALAEEQGFPIWSAGALIAQGWVLTKSAQEELGVRLIHQGIEAWRATGAEFMVPYFLALLADAYGKLGRAGEGLSLLTQALACVKVSGEHWFEAELHRLQGILLLSNPKKDLAQAEASFQQALTIARSQNASLWELRAATSLCQLWVDQGKLDEGIALLKPIYDNFTEGFDSVDFLKAKTLIHNLSGARAGQFGIAIVPKENLAD